METWNIPPVSFLWDTHSGPGEPPKASLQLFCANDRVSHDQQERRKRKKTTYISKAQVRRRLRSTLLLVVCPVEVLARVTCRVTKQNVSSASTSHQRESTEWTPRRQLCASASHPTSVTSARSVLWMPVHTPREPTLLQPRLTHLLHLALKALHLH